MPELSDEQKKEQKEILKEALKEWMDEKYAAVGRWAFSAFMVALLGAMVWLILVADGWQKKGS